MGVYAYEKHPKDKDFGDLKVLNLGCGFNKHKNAINIDAEAICEPDVCQDLSKPLPFEDESFDLIIASHILEHVPNWWKTFNECARILKVGGVLEVYVPGCGSDSALGYRDHINTINVHSFFGIANLRRSGGNAWAENGKGDADCEYAKYMDMFDRVHVASPDLKWLQGMSKNIFIFLSNHLRNIVAESYFGFRKLNQEQYDKVQKTLTPFHE